jgi:hypothetical protein
MPKLGGAAEAGEADDEPKTPTVKKRTAKPKAESTSTAAAAAMTTPGKAKATPQRKGPGSIKEEPESPTEDLLLSLAKMVRQLELALPVG